MAITVFIIFISFLLFIMPVFFCLAISTFLAMYLVSDINTIAIDLKMFRRSGDYHLIAVPFFILAGGFIESARFSRPLVNFASNFIGHVHGTQCSVPCDGNLS